MRSRRKPAAASRTRRSETPASALVGLVSEVGPGLALRWRSPGPAPAGAATETVPEDEQREQDERHAEDVAQADPNSEGIADATRAGEGVARQVVTKLPAEVRTGQLDLLRLAVVLINGLLHACLGERRTDARE